MPVRSLVASPRVLGDQDDVAGYEYLGHRRHAGDDVHFRLVELRLIDLLRSSSGLPAPNDLS